MGAFADLRDRVGDALDTVCVANPDWSVLRLPVDSLAPPVYMLGWSDPWVSGQATFCRYDVALDVRCIAARIEPDPGIELLEEMIEAAAVALDQARLPVRFVLPPRPFPIGGVTYQAALLTVTATVQLTVPAAPVGGVSGAAHLTAVALLTADGTVIAAGIVDVTAELRAAATLTAELTVDPAAVHELAVELTATAELRAGLDVAPSGPWTPAQMPGILGFWDPDVAESLTVSGSPERVSAMADLSGNGADVENPVAGGQFYLTPMGGTGRTALDARAMATVGLSAPLPPTPLPITVFVAHRDRNAAWYLHAPFADPQNGSSFALISGGSPNGSTHNYLTRSWKWATAGIGLAELPLDTDPHYDVITYAETTTLRRDGADVPAATMPLNVSIGPVLDRITFGVITSASNLDGETGAAFVVAGEVSPEDLELAEEWLARWVTG